MKEFIIFDKEAWKIVAEFTARDYKGAEKFSKSRGFTEEKGYYTLLKSDYFLE